MHMVYCSNSDQNVGTVNQYKDIIANEAPFLCSLFRNKQKKKKIYIYMSYMIQRPHIGDISTLDLQCLTPKIHSES